MLKRLVVIVAVLAAVVAVAPPASAGSAGEFVAAVNGSRAAAGLPPVQVDGGLAAAAAGHSAAMADAGAIYHSDSLASGVSGWEALAENVGVGPSVSSLHSAFMGSAGHRRNILGDYNWIGVGVVEADGALWVTVRFMRKPPPPPPAPQATTTTTSAPVPTTTVAARKAKPAVSAAADAGLAGWVRVRACWQPFPD